MTISVCVECIALNTERDQTLVKRECELKLSSEQCRTVLEQQLTELRGAHSSLQHELSQSREETRKLQAQLRDTVSAHSHTHAHSFTHTHLHTHAHVYTHSPE